jgi:lipopolysaccharide transport system permease protein
MTVLFDAHRLTAARQHGFLLWLWLKRDLKSRFAGSIGGLAWALLLPLFTVLLFYVVFALVLQVRVPELASERGYFLYLLAGLLPWLSIADGLSRAAGSLAGQEQFLQKIVFPIDVLPATAVVSGLLTQIVGTLVLLILLAGEGLLSIRLLLLPLVLSCQLLLCLGLGCALAILGVHLRDLLQLVPVLLQFLFYSAPILYPISLIPPGYHRFFLLNPFTGLIEIYHWLFLGLPVGWPAVAALLFWTMLLGVGGWLLFRALKPTLGDYL